MFLQPKKTKYKKIQKSRLKKLELKVNTIQFGEIGLKAQISGIITAKQIEAARQAINRKTNRKGKIWIRIFPDLPITSKPTESRMGKGKGALSHWAAKIKGGTTLFEICGVSTRLSIEALKAGANKLPIRTKIFD